MQSDEPSSSRSKSPDNEDQLHTAADFPDLQSGREFLQIYVKIYVKKCVDIR